jgi:predicted homoserine dehydrogenase-like protein
MNLLRIVLPVMLGVVAAVLNFIVLRGSTAPLELTTISADVKADTELTESMLDRIAVRADREIFKSAVPYSDHGLLLGRRVTRDMTKGEVVMWADLHNVDEENIRLYLKPRESTFTFPVKPTRIARGLKRGDSVGVFVAVKSTPNTLKATNNGLALPTTNRRRLGPFRLLSLGTPVDPSRMLLGESSVVTVAVMPRADGQLDADTAALDEAISSMTPGNNSDGVVAVEYYEPAKSR